MKNLQQNRSPLGIISGVSAYLIWGLSPVYWNLLQQTPALEIISHRIVWSFFLLIALTILLKQSIHFLRVFQNPKMILIMLITSILISINWLTYIWAVNNGFILQASLGYYINPLVNVVLGVVFLKERLRRLQLVAVLLAFAGVIYLTVFYNTFPWVSLTLAFSFGFYGLIRKMAPIGALVGLTVETMAVSIPASLFLFYLHAQGNGSFGNIDYQTDSLLVGASVVTALPLLLFNLAGKRLMLATLGFLQYLAPTCMFLIGTFLWGQEIVTAQLICFAFIWLALLLYSMDSLFFLRLHSERKLAANN